MSYSPPPVCSAVCRIAASIKIAVGLRHSGMNPGVSAAIGGWGRMASPTRVWVWLAFASAALLLAPCRAEEAATAAAEAAAAEEEPSFVLTLDSGNFSDAIAKHRFIVVEFYAPWCGHCKKLAPEYEKAAATLNKHDPPIVLAKVDANDEVNKELASKYEVKGYPTLKILKNEGKVIQEYKGPRDAEGIVEYLKKQVGPPSTELKSADDASTLFDEKKVYIVGLFSEFAGEEFESYMTVADILRSDYEFGHTLDVNFLPRGDASVKPPLVRLFKPFDELFVDFKDFHTDTLQKFIEEASMPLVTMFTNDPANHPYVIKFFESDNAKALLFMNFSSESSENFKSIYHDVARNYKGKKISFLMGDLDASQGAFQYFGLKEDQAPLIIVQTNDGQKYLKLHLEPAQLASWVKDYMEGNVKPFIKSEPIPEVNNEPVKVVVADSLRDVVFNSGKNVLLEFYAPWCGHCQKLAPILEEAALALQSDTDVVIAKMDATANDIPSDFEVQGYPTLYFRSASGKLVQFDGGRTKEDIIDFIQKNRDPVVETKAIKDEL